MRGRWKSGFASRVGDEKPWDGGLNSIQRLSAYEQNELVDQQFVAFARLVFQPFWAFATQSVVFRRFSAPIFPMAW